MREQIVELAVSNTRTTFGVLIVASAVTVMVFMTLMNKTQAQVSVCVSGGAVSEGSAALAADCETLLGMKQAIRGNGNLNWWSGRPIDRWDGIGVEEGRVVSVTLPERNLDGIVPPALGNLSALRSLDLSGNRLTGTIPSELDNLENLTTWRLAGNNLSGCVSAKLAQIVDNDLIALGLPICGGAPPPTTTTPPPSTDELSSLMTTANCTAEDISMVFGESFTLTNEPMMNEWGPNGRGWGVSYLTLWENTGETKDGLISCFTVLYDTIDNAFLGTNYHALRLWNDFSFVDTFMEVKMKEEGPLGLEPLGHEFIGMHQYMNDALFEDSLVLQVNSVMYRRSNLSVMLSASSAVGGEDEDTFPFLDRRIAEVADNIDRRLIALGDMSFSHHASKDGHREILEIHEGFHSAIEELYASYAGTGLRRSELPFGFGR